MSAAAGKLEGQSLRPRSKLMERLWAHASVREGLERIGFRRPTAAAVKQPAFGLLVWWAIALEASAAGHGYIASYDH
jgi:hypothetical protein